MLTFVVDYCWNGFPLECKLIVARILWHVCEFGLRILQFVCLIRCFCASQNFYWFSVFCYCIYNLFFHMLCVQLKIVFKMFGAIICSYRMLFNILWGFYFQLVMVRLNQSYFYS